MKNILSIALVMLISLSIVACDNQKKEPAENLTEDQELIKIFKDSYNKQCLATSGGAKAFCECVYEEIINKYPETELVDVFKRNNSTEIEKLLADVPELAKKCLD